MAELDQEEFKFPDEIKGKPVDTLSEGGDFSLEIEDDTPADDKFAEPPLSKEEVDELEKDNHEDYSKRVKDRIDKMKKAWHDERREKEAALREQQEAINLAKRVMDEHKKLKEAYSTGEKEYISTFQNAADLQLEIAKQAYREAYDSGDSERIVEAQAKLTEASLKQDKAKNFKPAPQAEEETFEQAQQAYQQPAKPQVDPLTAKWLENNSWYGPDEEMTALALGTHTKLEKEFGKSYIGSEEYFKRIDQTMRKRFPENFSEEVEVETQAGGDKPSQRAETKSAPVVAPATRSTAAKRIVLKASQVALAKKLGLTPEQYAREMQKLEA
jgi:hypothetical protein